MSHDATKVLMGNVLTNSKEMTEHLGSPATFIAGLAIRQKSDGVLSVTKADGQWLGISLGKGLSDSLKTVALCRSGLKVPVLLERQPARGLIEITDYAALVSGTDDSITVGATVFTAQAGAATLGQTTFQAATSNDDTATSLAAQINSHATASTLVKATVVAAVVTLTAISNSTSGDSIAMAYTDNDSNIGATVSGATLTDSDDSQDYVTIGEKVYFSDSTGKADDQNSGSTISDAIYVSGVLTGIQEDGTEAACALVDMGGGL